MSSDPTKASRATGEGRARRAGAARPVVALVSICAISSVLLGVANYVTAPIAAAREAERAQRTYAALMPEAASFEEVPCDVEGCTAAFLAVLMLPVCTQAKISKAASKRDTNRLEKALVWVFFIFFTSFEKRF